MDCYILKLSEVCDKKFFDFEEVFELQNKLVRLRLEDKILDTLILLEHNHVITAGKSATKEDFKIPLDEKDGKIFCGTVPVVWTDRGGKLTYHGPGQLVGYLIRDLQLEAIRDGFGTAEDFGIVSHMRKLCELMGNIVEKYLPKDVAIEPPSKQIGTFTVSSNGRYKVGSAAVKDTRSLKRAVTKHGLALNINTDLAYFHLINPCGYDSNIMTSLAGIVGKEIDMSQIEEKAVREFVKIFGYNQALPFPKEYL